jgi:histidyl-tRNA synthetase
LEKGLASNSISKLTEILQTKESNLQNISHLKASLMHSEVGLEGLSELEKVFEYLEMNIPYHRLVFDPSLARGLSYYTGAIFEIKADGVQIGSISGGGRYDNLTGLFGLPNVSGVGISFGIDRIFDVMEELSLFPENELFTTKVLLMAMDDSAINLVLKTAQKLREAGIQSEVYPEVGAKMKKQLGYADARKIPFALIVGSEEVQSKLLTIKNLNTGEQLKLPLEDILRLLA